MLVAFHVSESQSAIAGKGGTKSKNIKIEADKLKQELQYTRETLQSTIEELETTNEELKSTNEELQATNEELQSSGEELETSKEELQSLNEELQATNMELQAKVDELTHVNDDMKNLLDSTEIATIFLDSGLNIRRFTSATKKVVNLINPDEGRPISDISFNLKYQNLVKNCQSVLKTLVCREKVVQTKEGFWFIMRITPYRTSENKIAGLVLTFVDIDKIKMAQLDLEESRQA
jgi:two-component system CheB/CheR fusion protein